MENYVTLASRFLPPLSRFLNFDPKCLLRISIVNYLAGIGLRFFDPTHRNVIFERSLSQDYCQISQFQIAVIH